MPIYRAWRFKLHRLCRAAVRKGARPACAPFHLMRANEARLAPFAGRQGLRLKKFTA
jgi:hypothetical protein